MSLIKRNVLGTNRNHFSARPRPAYESIQNVLPCTAQRLNFFNRTATICLIGTCTLRYGAPYLDLFPLLSFVGHLSSSLSLQRWLCPSAILGPIQASPPPLSFSQTLSSFWSVSPKPAYRLQSSCVIPKDSGIVARQTTSPNSGCQL